MGPLVTALRRARQRLADLPEIPEPWDVRVFTRRVAELRSRPIELLPRVMSHYASVATGLWIRRESRDLIVYDSSGPELHQDHIVLHELGHMLCGHQGVSVDANTGVAGRASAADALTAVLAAGDRADPQSEQPPIRVLHRSAYDSAEELEAETLAYAIWQAAGLRVLPEAGPAGRLANSFEHH